MSFIRLTLLAVAFTRSLAAAPSGKYEGRVLPFIDITMDFTSTTAADVDVNVIIAHKEIKCAAVAIAVSDTQVTFPSITKTGDCMGDAIRGQKKDPSKYFVSINEDGTLTFHSDGYPAMKLKKKSLAVMAAPSGKYEGRVLPFIDITMDFTSTTEADVDVNVIIAHKEIKCAAVPIAVSDTEVTFPNIAKTGDCMGDAIRGQKKNPSKYFVSINEDGTLSFHSDGYPAMKLKKKSLAVMAAPSGKYEGRVLPFIDITMDFTSTTEADVDVNVIIAHKEIKCAAVPIAVSDTEVTFPNIAKTGDCMGDAIRGQKKNPSKYFVSINEDGTLSFHSDGYPAMKLKKKSLAVMAAPSGKYEGRVLPFIDIIMDFTSTTEADVDVNVIIAHKEIKCAAVPIDVSDTEVTFPNIAKTGDCMGDAIRGQKKNPSKYFVSINEDGTLSFHSDGYPAMKLKKKSLAVMAAPSGKYEGRVLPFIDITMDFTSSTAADVDVNVIIAHKEIKCAAVPIDVSDTEVTFPSITKTGDCMGDAIRGQKKDPSKYFVSINEDGTLTFHSDGYPAMKLKKKSLAVMAAPSGKYEGRVLPFIDITMDFTSTTAADVDVNVIIAHKEIKCAAVPIAVSDTEVTFPSITKTGDCMGDAIRGQKKNPSKYFVSINEDGTLTFHSDGYPAMKLKKKSLAAMVAPTGEYEGRVLPFIDITMDFTSATAADVDVNVIIAHKEIKCAAVPIAVSDTEVTFPNITKAGDCMGDAIRGQKKNPSKYFVSINEDGTLTFHSDGYPAMKLKKKGSETIIV